MTPPDSQRDCSDAATASARLDQGTVAAAQKLARVRLAPLPHRWAHTIGVAAAAPEMSGGLSPTARIAVTAAAWLHDIGYGPSLVDTGFHPLDSARFLQRAGFHTLIVSLVAHHTGADNEAHERGLLAELAEFPPVLRPVLDALTAADLTTSPDGSPVDPADRISEILSRYPPTGPVHRAVSRSRPQLLAAAARARKRTTT
jgi:hypothetical protein